MDHEFQELIKACVMILVLHATLYSLIRACHAPSTNLVLHATLYSTCSILIYCIAGYTLGVGGMEAFSMGCQRPTQTGHTCITEVVCA